MLCEKHYVNRSLQISLLASTGRYLRDANTKDYFSPSKFTTGNTLRNTRSRYVMFPIRVHLIHGIKRNGHYSCKMQLRKYLCVLWQDMSKITCPICGRTVHFHDVGTHKLNHENAKRKHHKLRTVQPLKDRSIPPWGHFMPFKPSVVKLLAVTWKFVSW